MDTGPAGRTVALYVVACRVYLAAGIERACPAPAGPGVLWPPCRNPQGQLNRALDKLLAEPLIDQPAKIATFQKRLIKNREAVFRFLEHPEMPPTNNASERAIRNITVKRKISGQFKSNWGAEAYAVIRSVIDTAIKRNLNVMEQIINIANLASY